MKLLYHYTTLAGLEGILKSKALWASHAQSLNDRRELTEGYDLLKLSLPSFETDIHALNSLNTEVERLSASIEQPVYVCSLSRAMDSLAQWRAYGNSARGFAIGFDSNSLASLFPGVTLRRVLYCKHDATNVKFSEGMDFVQKHVTGPISAAIMPHSRTTKARRTIEDAVMLAVASTKNYGFREEREERLIAIRPKTDIQFHGSDDKPIPHVELASASLPENRQPLPIRSVWVHPAEPQDAFVEGLKVQKILRAHGYTKVRVRYSGIPYRG